MTPMYDVNNITYDRTPVHPHLLCAGTRQELQKLPRSFEECQEGSESSSGLFCSLHSLGEHEWRRTRTTFDP